VGPGGRVSWRGALLAKLSALVNLRDHFHRFAVRSSTIVGAPWSFLLAIVVIVVWSALGPVFRYSDTWQLVINTGTTIVTFLMVFLIQNSQNRDAKAIHLKLDELIRAHRSARNELIDLEQMTERELDQLHEEFVKTRDRRVQGRQLTPPSE
jgi:low affinity Fe/Cu permease